MISQNQPRIDQQRIGIVPGAAQLAIEVVDRTQTTAIAVMHDVRTELRAAIEGSIELTERTVGGMFRIAKKLTQRIDEAAGDTLTNLERLIASSLRGATTPTTTH